MLAAIEGALARRSFGPDADVLQFVVDLCPGRKLFGLNRHQWYPFAGGALPDRVQRRDAEILRRELNCTMVRCSRGISLPEMSVGFLPFDVSQ